MTHVSGVVACLPALLALLALLALPAAAIEHRHRLAEGERLADVAQRYYGDQGWSEALRLYNEIERDAESGRIVSVPLADIHRIEEGDSWPGLAQRYWGDADRFRELAELSGRVQAVLTPGESVRIPALIPHRVRPGESFAALSRRLYGGPERARALARLNTLVDPDRLAAGQVVTIPVLAVRSRDAGVEPALPDVALAGSPTPVADTAPMPRPDPATVSRHAESLAGALELYDAGRFDAARDALEALRTPILAEGDGPTRIALLRQLVRVYTAFDQPDRACASDRALRALAPRAEWDPIRTSPRVIRVLDDCSP